jgi:hypothetical protein
MLATASAAEKNYNASVTGGDVFVHDHEGIPHTHYFVFRVSGIGSTSQGHFSLVCKHDGQIETII